MITGFSGFVGSWLCEEVRRRGWQVTGLLPPGEEFNADNPGFSEVDVLRADILDKDALTEVLVKTGADTIIHMAARSAPSRSFKDPVGYFNVNVLGTQYLLEAARTCRFKGRILLFTSADMYGLNAAKYVPVTESTPLSPNNPYSASKAACHEIGRQYALHFGLHVVEVRPFNMVGPRQAPGFVLPDWCSQVARIITGRQDPVLEVGRLTDQRDFIDVRDAARAIADIATLGERGQVYQVCSGTGTEISYLLDLVLAAADTTIEVRQDKARLRPSVVPVFFGSNRKMADLSGWRPQISLRQTVIDTLGWWLDAVSG